jgi:DNA-binding HxlR family transcriptional regulator
MILRQFTWPGDLTMTLIGGKWKPLIIFHLLQSGQRRFNELKNRMPGISAKMLAKHLRELELDGLLVRNAGEGKAGKIHYSATDRSRDLAPVLDAMYRWAKQNGSAYGDPSESHAYPGFEPGAQALFTDSKTQPFATSANPTHS